jgi:hypothetical protein
MKSGLDFIACDNLHATRLTIHMLTAIAEDEARRIGERTKAALATYQARGGLLGGSLLQSVTCPPRPGQKSWSTQAETDRGAGEFSGDFFPGKNARPVFQLFPGEKRADIHPSITVLRRDTLCPSSPRSTRKVGSGRLRLATTSPGPSR